MIAYETAMTGAEMKELRERLGWSQQRLATELGMSVSQISLASETTREILNSASAMMHYPFRADQPAAGAIVRFPNTPANRMR